MTKNDELDDLSKIATGMILERNLGELSSLVPLTGGRNNRAFRVEGPGGPWLLKQYFADLTGLRDRRAGGDAVEDPVRQFGLEKLKRSGRYLMLKHPLFETDLLRNHARRTEQQSVLHDRGGCCRTLVGEPGIDRDSCGDRQQNPAQQLPLQAAMHGLPGAAGNPGRVVSVSWPSCFRVSCASGAHRFQSHRWTLLHPAKTGFAPAPAW